MSDQTRKASDMPLPGGDFRLFVQSLAHQGAVALALIENPLTQKKEQDLPTARYFIDLLAMLEEKTQGNLTPDETKFLGDVLSQLRMAFVGVEKAAGGSEGPASDPAPEE